jgi:hypothetical protein
MANRNNTILWLQGPSESDSQQGVVTGQSVTAENNNENSSDVASTLQNVTRSKTNLTYVLEKGTTQTNLSVEVATTNNFNILAMAATAATMVLPRVPERLSLPFSSPNPHNPPLREVNLHPNSSPLTEITNNFSSGENRSSSTENRSESIPLSTTNARYQAASEGAYLSVPETIGLRAISCLNEDAHDMGYDSDGELGPFFDAVLHEVQWDDYDEQPYVNIEEQPQDDTAPAPATAMAPPQLSESDIRRMKVAELRKELKSRRQSVNGAKDVLVQRLLACSHLPPSNDMAIGAVANDNQPMDTLHHGVKWRLLEPDATPLEEPSRMRSLVAPTAHAAGATTEAKKYNYLETFDRDPFTATSKTWVRNNNGTLKIDRNTNEPVLHTEIHENGRPKWSFLKENNLTVDSHPAEWFFSLLPEKKKHFHPVNVATMEGWTMYSNLKAMLAQAGTSIYKGFEPFTTADTKRYIGLMMLHGLAPSPRMSYKFRSQASDPVNGNDLVSESFGKNAEKRLKMWKLFFGVQDPRKATPSRKTHPNWKIDPFLTWMGIVFRHAWHFGRYGSCDEQDIGFTGKHEDKQRINYKDEGDGFLTDSIADSGYTYCFFFRNQPAPAHYVRQGYSPTHARVLHLFDLLPSKNHIIGLDNLFMSAKLCIGAYKGKNQVQIHGVVRKNGRGVPSCVLQEFQKNPKEADKVRGTIKAAVLDNDPGCPSVICVSYYDSKDVYFMSTSATEIKWVEKERRVYHKEEQKVVKMKFLRPKIVDDYNNGMNKVDQADQLRSVYRFDLWTRTRKWWWAIWLWGVQVCLVNAYVMYRHAHLYIWKMKESSLLSHYDFQKMVALHLINPEKYPLSGSRQKRKCDDGDDSRTLRSRNSDTENSSKKSAIMNDKTLHPDQGELRIRLNTGYFHCPVRPKAKDPSCQLHRWASGDPKYKNRGSILHCDCCNVNVCIECFDLYHKVSDVNRLRSEVLKVIINEKNSE